MKKTAILLAALAVTATGAAQSLSIVCGDVTYRVPAAQAGEMKYSTGTQLTVMGKTLELGDVSRMYVDGAEAIDNSVIVKWTDQGASVTVGGNIMRYVDASVSGGHVSIVQSADLGDAAGEITYRLSGSSGAGNFTLSGSYKATVSLEGLALTSDQGAAIDIQCGKRIKLRVADGTENTLTDAAGGSQKAALYCKGHLEIKDSGTLTVTGKTGHAISAKEYITLQEATVRVHGSVKDGLNCNQYYAQKSGVLDIAACGDDALQASFKDDTDREPEDTGSITISGGTITAAVTATAAKGIKADGNITVTGGTITVSTTGGALWDETAVKTKASTCISADGIITIEDGKFDLRSTGPGGKSISCDGDLIVSGGTFECHTSGGMFAYVNGTTYDNYTGNTDNLDSDYKSSPKAIKSDGNVTISGGVFNVSTKGNGGEGIESKAVLTISGGSIVARCSDDCINSSSHMYIKGGDIDCLSSTNDALDSNGNLVIEGGTVRAFAVKTPECGLDANDEEGYTVIFKGGSALGIGSRNSVPTSAESTQPYLSCSLSVSAGSTLTVKSGTTVLASFAIPADYQSAGGGPRATAAAAPGGGPGGGFGSSGGVIITCPGLVSGNSYTVSCGSNSVTATAALKGSSGGPGF